MKLKIYTLYDEAAKAFTTPFFQHNDGLAIRAFQDNVNAKEDNNISKHPGHFTLFRVGEFDDEKGEIKQEDVAKNLGNGLTYRNERQENQEYKELKKLLVGISEKIEAKA